MVAERAFDLAIRLTEKLGSLAYDEISLAWGVKSDLRKLEDTMSTIKGVLLDAEEKQANNKELRSWLRQVKNVCLDAEDVLDEFDCEALRKQVVEKFHGTSRKVRRFFSRSNPIAFRFRVAHEIKELRERLEELKANKSIFDSLTSHSQGYYGDHDSNLKHVLKARETHSFVRASEVVGRGFEKEAIVGRLIEQADDHVSVIPVVGMGGLGKTTLAKLVYNDTRVIKNFELMIWQYVSIDFDVARLTKEILSSALGTNISGELSMNQLQEKLRDALKDKKFLLVLDDVWNEDAYKWGELKDLLVEGAKLGSKVLVTTRNVSVASIMGTVPTNINLQNLSKEDCMSLFVKCAFKEGEEREHPNLFEIGKDIVRKCGGVPLAVKTLGCQLYSKTDEREWAMIRDSAIWELEREGVAHVLPALRLSYTHLPSHLRRCLAYCSLLPRTYEDHDSRLLINIWMANGILESHDHGNLELEDVGELYFKELCERSFFQNVQDLSLYCEFDMHDLIHDLVRSVAQDECCAVDFEGTKEISENVRHLSVSGPAQNVPSIFLQTCFSDLDKRNRLRSITVRDIDINESFLQTCFSRFKYLRMLILFESTFEAFPSSIVSLKHMRYLDLSGNESISKLPDAVCKLQSLEILSVNGCANLEELPRDISKLISLRVLHITTKQTSFPDNGVGCMKSLRSLSIVDCGNLTSLPRDMSYLAALHTLMIWDCEQLDLANGNYQLIPLRLRSLRIAGVPKMVALPEWLRGAANTLRVLCISDCENLDALPEWLTSFTSLRILDLRVCPKLVSLPEGMHPLEVKIEDCPQLKRTRSASKGKNDKTAMQAAAPGSAAKAVPGGAGVEYGGEAGGKLVHFDGPFVFTVDDLLCATAEIMGKSTYGTAYKATLEEGNQVAVKRLREKTAKGQKEFEMEAAAIGKIRHPNLLSLRAYYLGPEEKLLVFDYMPKGSLASFLHARGPETIIDWPTRMNIVIGITRGLCHLHNEENIVHGNLTSSNILLDEQTNAHIADFGLSRLMTAAANTNVIATAGTLGYNAPELSKAKKATTKTDVYLMTAAANTNVIATAGTLGYNAPELSKAKKATTKTDVYSLGVIILELLTGKSPGEPMNGMDLPRWVASIVKEEWTNEVFDLEIMRDVPTIGDMLLNTLKLALHCVDPSPALRPEAQQVLEQLEEIKPDQATGGSAEEEGAEVPPPAGSSN